MRAVGHLLDEDFDASNVSLGLVKGAASDRPCTVKVDLNNLFN